MDSLRISRLTDPRPLPRVRGTSRRFDRDATTRAARGPSLPLIMEQSTQQDAPDYSGVRASINLTAFRAAALFMGQCDIRYYLNGVFIERDPDGKGCWVVATNGSSMLIYADDSGVLEGPLNKIIVRPSKALLGTAARVKKPDFRAIVTGKRLSVATDFGMECDDTQEVFVQAGSCQIQGHDKYPKWRRVVPQFDKLTAGHPGNFDPALFLPVHQANKVLSPPRWASHGIQFWSQGHNKDAACIQFCSDDKALAIIMPRHESAKLPAIIQTINSQYKK